MVEGPTARRAGWCQVSSSSRHRLLDSVPGTVLVASRVSGTWASIQVASSGMATYKSRRRLVKLGTLPQLTPLQGGGSTSEQAAPYSLPPGLRGDGRGKQGAYKTAPEPPLPEERGPWRVLGCVGDGDCAIGAGAGSDTRVRE